MNSVINNDMHGLYLQHHLQNIPKFCVDANNAMYYIDNNQVHEDENSQNSCFSNYNDNNHDESNKGSLSN